MKEIRLGPCFIGIPQWEIETIGTFKIIGDCDGITLAVEEANDKTKG